MTETKVTSLSDHREQRAESRFEAAIRKFMAIGRTQEEAIRIIRAAYESPEAFEAFLREGRRD
jgi:hypothetical protein